MKAAGIFVVISIYMFQLTLSQGMPPDLQFLSIKEELSQNTVTSILQDQRGFLWIGTRSGLNKYDGINMQSYMHSADDTFSIKSNYVRSMYLLSDNRILIGTLAAGFCIYEESLDRFSSLGGGKVPRELETATVNSFYEDEDHNIWFATERNGLFFWDHTQKTFSQYRHNEKDLWGLASNNITGIIGDGRGNLWVATWGGGLNLFDSNTKRFIVYKHSDDQLDSPVSDIIRCIAPGGPNHIWIGTDQGVDKVSYDPSGKYKFEHLSTKEGKGEESFVLTLWEDEKNRLWIGSENQGVCAVDIPTKEYHWFSYDSKNPYSIKNNSIWSIFEDRNGLIWIGTFNKGLFKLDESYRKLPAFKHNPYDDAYLTNSAVSSFFEDKNNNVWIGTDGGGLDYWDVEKGTFEHFRKEKYPAMSNEVLSLMIDQNENVWVGNWQGGVLVKMKGNDRFEPFELEYDFDARKNKENIFSIMEDSNGSIWFVAFRKGLIRYDPMKKAFSSYSYDEYDDFSISSNLIRHIYQDSRGRIWLGTEGTGLDLLEDPSKEIFKNYKNISGNTSSLSENMVHCIIEDSDRRIWIGTAQGLNLFDESNQTFVKFGYEHGFADEVIHAMETDDLGNLWLSTNKGIIRFNLSDYSVRNFDLDDGLQAMEFFKNSSYKLSSGILLFGGVDGFNLINAEQIKDEFEEPQVYLADFKVSNKSIKREENNSLRGTLFNGGDIHLNFNQNDISFEFSQINFNQSSKNIYAYKLQNYDDQWQQAGSRREAYYTNVPAGNYVFKVKGTDNGGVWSGKEGSIRVIIEPAWYNTGWAHFVYVLLVLGILYWSFHTIVNRERLQSNLALEHLELSKMQELDQMKSSFFANISHEFRSPLTLILGPLKAMVENNAFTSTKEQVAMMLRSAENLLNLINQLLELSKLESGKMRLELVSIDLYAFLKPILHSFSSLANAKNIAYKIVIPRHETILSFDKDKLEKIVVNLLSNAFKYTDSFGKVTITVVEEADKVILKVADDGIGIPSEDQDYIFNRYYRVRDNKTKKNKGTGIGLALTKELTDLHHGHIDFVSEEGKGTTFMVHLFKGKAHFESEDFVEEKQSLTSPIENQIVYEQDERNQRPVSVDENITDEEADKFPYVLVIEDNVDIRIYIKSILDTEYTVLEAENGVDGIQMAKEQIPDLIISDVMMPGKDGFEVCREVKSDEKTSHIPIILLTAKASNTSAVNGFELGADYYITKPFNPKLLSLRVRNALKTRDQIRGQLMNKNQFNIEPKNVKIASRDEEFINKAVSAIEENISNSEFYVEDLGRELGMSRMQLYRKLKALIGLSANEFIRSIRLKRAAQLIKQNEMNISEITYQVGFNDLQYFRDCFKKQYGVNPSEYAQDIVEKTH